MPRAEDANFRTIDEVRVVRVHPEANRRRMPETLIVHMDIDAGGLGRYGQPRARAQVVVAELDIGAGEGNVGATLDIGRTTLGIVDRLAVHRNAHHIQTERIFRIEFSRHARDIDAFVIIEYREFVVNDLNGHVRRIALDETGIDDVIGVDEAATFEFGLLRRELHLSGNLLHGSTGA